jgi:iron complex outermembrane receptor protein
MKKSLFILLLLVYPALASAAEVVGRVVSAGGTPIEHARIDVVESDRSAVFTDMRGEFLLENVEPPIQLVITHPRFFFATHDVEEVSQKVELTLEPKQEIYEAIAVTANPGEENFSPVSVAISVLDPEKSSAPPNSLTEFVSQTPGVSENGQGGLFQTYSVRGVSRLRVMTLVSGMRIVSERRAGVSASFIDPLLMGSADVLRGPSSTFYGSGALGGVVQLFPAFQGGWTVQGGYDSRGDELHQFVGWGSDKYSVALAHRDADNAETPAGDELNSGFQQTSGTVGTRWSAGGLGFDFTAIGSAGRDIQKSNIDFPERTTTYPEENHLLLRFGVRSEDGWDLTAYVHPNDLVTEISRDDGRLDTVDNDAFDLGASWQKRLQPSRSTVVRLGVDYFGRRSVDALEVNQVLEEGELVETNRQSTLQGGEEDEAGLFGAVEWNLGQATLLAGGRYAWQQQQNEGFDSTSDGALTGFAGLVAPVGGGVEIVANIGSGLRFPSLSERFFTGTTGRGFVVGNPTLDPERSLNIDAGARWYGDKLFLSGYLFRNAIDDYVERIEVAPRELTFVNLTSGTIEGVELEGFLQLAEAWSVSFGGHSIRGRDDDDEPLADIPASSVFLGARWGRGKWSWDGRLEARQSKDDPGSGEQQIPSANLLSSSVSYEIQPGLRLALSGRNLLDEEYFNSADSDVPLSPTRSFGASLRWQP